MANANSLIQSTVTSGSPQVIVTGFGDIMVLLDSTDAPGFGSNEVRVYGTSEEIDADGPAPGNADLSEQGVINLKAAINQPIRPPRVKAGAYNELNTINTELAAIQLNDDNWYGLCVTGSDAHNNADILLIAAFVNSRTKPTLYFATSAEADVLNAVAGNTFLDLQVLSYNRTAYFYHDPETEPAVISAMAAFLAVDPDNGTTIVAWKTLVGITKQLQLTTTELFANMLDIGVNVYTEVRGIGSVQKGKLVSGEFIDIQLSKDWLAARIAEDMTQAEADFSNDGSKIPYDAGGIAITDNIIGARLEQAVRVKHLERRAPGTNSPTDKGSPFIDPLFLVDVPSNNRTTRNIVRTYGGTFAGAIQEASFTGTVSTS